METRDISGGYPDLTASQLDVIRERSTEMVVDPGASLGDAGDVDFDLMLVEAGDVEVVRLAAFGLPEQVMAIFGPGSFLGELDMLTGGDSHSTRSPAKPMRGVGARWMTRGGGPHYRNAMVAVAQSGPLRVAPASVERRALGPASAFWIEPAQPGVVAIALVTV